MKKKSTFSLLLASLSFSLGSFLFTSSAVAAPELIKSVQADTIYYLDSYGIRHAFPNLTTYQSWYGHDFSHVISLSDETLATFSLGKNSTIRPGTKLVKVPSAPAVYAVEQGGLLREIKNDSIAEAIYGPNWSKRVVDVPEVFFNDYRLGPMINHEYLVPGNTLFQDKATKKYYYLSNNVLREFASAQAMADNHFSPAEAFVSSRQYYVRTRPITGVDKNVFNPAADVIADTRDCVSTNLKAAFIFLAKKAYTAAEVKKVETIKTSVAPYFRWASNELSSIDVAYPTAVMLNDGYIMKEKPDGATDINNEAISTFYDTNADVFDFIFVFTDFDIPKETSNEIAYFIPVTNKVEGLGRSVLNRSNLFGSTGKLKGIIMMGNINQYDPGSVDGLSRTMDIVAHELLHNWGAYALFDDNGTPSKELLRTDGAHWSIYDAFISPLGGGGWIDNGNGTYTSGFLSLADTNKRPYTSFDLYLMGLLPKQVIAPITYLAPTTPGDIGNTIGASVKTVTIDQVIRSSGERKCSLD